MFEIYFDDSKSQIGNQILVVAGYLDSQENWFVFSSLWKACLEDTPSIAYLKMSEAKALQGQFKGWDPALRDQKLLRLARIIEAFQPLSFVITLECKKFDEHLKGVGPYGVSPHFLCINTAIVTVCRFLSDQKSSERVKITFDSQEGTGIDVELIYDWFLKSIPKKAAQLLYNKPLFLDDREVVPLQAADFLAWHVRRKSEGSMKNNDLLHRIRKDLVMIELTESHLQDWGKQMLKIPGIESVRGKKNWKTIRDAIEFGKRTGFIPPYGTKWKNIYRQAYDSIRKVFDRS